MEKFTTSKTQELAREIGKKLKPHNVLALYGDLGSGKTTFTRYLVEALGFADRVQSPTFVILRKYVKSTNEEIGIINHLDLYRLSNTNDLRELGLKELFEERKAITIIEWPEIAEALLPKDTIKIFFEYFDENERKINVQNIY